MDPAAGAMPLIKTGLTLFGANLATLVLPWLALGLAMYLAAGSVAKSLMALFGRKGYLAILGWLSTSLHELGHALFCLVFFHRITEIKLFSPDPATGALGYVKHSWDAKNPYQVLGNVFIAAGPIILGLAVITAAGYLLLPGPAVERVLDFVGSARAPESLASARALAGQAGDLFRALAASIFSREYMGSWKFFLFLYLLVAAGESARLSPADIRGGLSGFFMLLLILLLVSGFMGAFGLDGSLTAGLFRAASPVFFLLSLSLLANLLMAGLLLGLRIIWKNGVR